MRAGRAVDRAAGLFGLLAAAVVAANPVVSAQAPSARFVDAGRGHDANPGTQERPWRTLGHAASGLDAGETLYVRQGDYRSQGIVSVRLQGDRSAPVRVLAFRGERAVVQGLRVADSAWLEIAGLTIVGPKKLPAGWRDMPEVVIDDPSIRIDPRQRWRLARMQLVRKKYRSYVEFWDWDQDWSAGVTVSASRDITVRANDISLHSAGIELRDGSTRILVEGNRIHHAHYALWGGVRQPGGVSFEDCVIRGNTVYQIYGEGLCLTKQARRNTVEGNDVRHTGHNHISTFAAGGGNVIRNNTVRHGGYYSETMRWPGASAISIHSGGPGNRVEGNTIAYQYDSLLVDGNGIISDHNPDGALIANNVIYRVAGSGVSSVRSGNNVIVHNTIIESGHGSPSKKNGAAIRLVDAADVDNVIANNIFYRPHLGGISSENGRLQAQRFIDGNLFALVPGTAFAGNGLETSRILFDLTSYQRTGHDEHAVVGDPLFVDITGSDFHVQASSPAVGRGVADYTTEHDKDGRRRDRRRPTIGAYESR